MSAATIAQRTYQVGRASAALGSSPHAASTEALVGFLGTPGWSPNTRRAYRAALLGFFGWMVRTGQLSASPAAGLPPVRVPRGRPRPTPETAFRYALRVADARARLAIQLAGVCGLRRAEIAATRREDVEADLLGHVLRVAGKGGHVRLVPLPENLAREIMARPAGWLFPSPVRPGAHLTPHHLGKVISSNLPDGLTTHTLRHRCGTVAYAATGDLRAVQELLGHAKPETTALYTAISGEAIRAAMSGAA